MPFSVVAGRVKILIVSLTVSGVLEEAEFYNITSLIKLIKDKIRERDCKTSQVHKVLFKYFSPWMFHSCSINFCVISPVVLSGSSEACVPGAAVPGGGADTDGVDHVWRLEVWTGKSLPAGSQQQSSFHVLHPPRYAHIDPESPILNIGRRKKNSKSFSMSAYMIRTSLLCSDWLLQLVSIGYGRAHQSEFLLIVSREVKGEESALPNNSGEVCLTNFCPRAGHCMVPMLSIHTPLAIVCPK